MNAEEQTAILLDDIEQETALLQDRLTRTAEMTEGFRRVLGPPLPTRWNGVLVSTLRALVDMNKAALKVCEDTGADCLCSDLEDLQPLN